MPDSSHATAESSESGRPVSAAAARKAGTKRFGIRHDAGSASVAGRAGRGALAAVGSAGAGLASKATQETVANVRAPTARGLRAAGKCEARSIGPHRLPRFEKPKNRE